MGWTVDDIDLDTLAFNISNRAASWKTPPKRGTNLIIPGRHGARWLPNKPFEQGNVTLNMWAVGAEEDGSMPEIGSLQRKVRENIDKLTAIFGQSSKLLDVVRVSSTAFGVENTVNDPSFETEQTVSAWTSYQNQILNPAMRATTASVDEVNNLMPNPAPVTLQTPNTQINYENLVKDPQNKRDRALARATVAQNAWNSSWEENINPANGDWTDATNVNGNVTGYSAFDTIANPLGGSWFLSLELTGNVASNGSLGFRPSFSTTTASQPAPTGARPNFTYRARRAAAMTVGTRTVECRLLVLNSADATIQTGSWQSFSLPTYTGDAASWGTFNYDSTGLAMDSSGNLRVEFRTGQAWVTGDRFYMDMNNVTLSDQPGRTGGYWDTTPGIQAGGAGPYFDAYTGWANYEFVTPGNEPWTRSRVSVYKDTRWTVAPATGSGSAYYAYAYTPNNTDAAGTSLNFCSFGLTAGGTQDFYLDVANPAAGETYSYNFNWRALTGSYTLCLQKKGTGDANFVDTGTPFTFSGTTGTTGTVTTAGAQMGGTPQQAYPPSTYTAASGDLLRIRVTVPVRTDGIPGFQLNSLCVVNIPGRDFNGDTTDTTNSIYSWSGTTNDSKTNYAQRRLKRITGRHAYITDANPSRAEAIVAGNGVSTKIVTENFAIINGLRGIHGSASVAGSLSPYGTANSVGMPNAIASVVFLDAGSSVLSTVVGEPVTLTNGLSSGSYKIVNVSVQPSFVPAAATQVRLEISLVSPLAGQMMNVRELGLYTYGAPMTSIGLPAYFDGSTSGASWISTANDSTSRMTFSGTEPATWVRENGINLGLWIPGGPQKSGKSPDSYISFRHPMSGTTLAQEFQFGVESYGETYDATGTRIAVPLDVFLEFRSGTSTVVGSPIYIGTLGSSNIDLPQPLQATVTPSGTFDNIAVVYRARTAVATVAVAMFRSYLYPSAIASFSSPVPRMDYNRINNPYLTYGLELWAVTGSPVVTGGVCSMPNGSTLQSTPRLNPPTHVRTVSTGYTAAGGTLTSPTFDVVNGDLVVIQVGTADESHVQGTPTFSGSGTVTPQAGATIAGTDFVNASTWTIPVTATATGRSVAVTNTNTTVPWGFTVSIWRNHNGVGAVAEVNTTGPAAPSLNITTTVPGSALCVLVGDWTGGNVGVPRTWRTVNNAPIYETGFGDSTSATYFTGLVTDAGSVGSKTVGLTTPSNTKATVVAIEIRPATPTAITGVPVQAPQRVLNVETIFTTGASKTSPTFDVQQGDLLIIQAAADGTSTIPTPTWTGTGGAPVLQEDMATGNTRGRIWSIDVTAAATLRTVSINSYPGGGVWAFDVTVWRAHGGVGVQNQSTGSTGAPAITQTVAANSAVQFMALDELANVATPPTWATINGSPMTQVRYERQSGLATIFSSYSPDVGAAGSKTFGMTAPNTGLTFAATSIEILGAPKMNFIVRALNGSGNGRITPSIIWTKTDYSTVTVTLPPVDSTSLGTPVRYSVAIPANTTAGAVRYVSSVSSGSDPQVAFSYLGVASTGFTSYLDVDPFPFYYGDATSGDFFGTPGWWSGTADASISNFQPAVSPSWVNVTTPTGVSIHELPSPSIDYGVWNGQVGGILAAPKGVTRTIRSVGAPTFGRNFVSGEISVGTKSFATVQVKIYQASTASATGTLIHTSAVVPSKSSAILAWHDLPVTDSFVYAEVIYTESENVSGYRVFIDNFLIVPTETELSGEYPGYFDGNIGGIWTGPANNSVSTFQGGGRRAWCEVIDAIDMTSQAGGTRAEFTVDMEIPSAFWEDLSTSNMVFTLPSLSGYEQTLHALATATAPIDDAVITLNVSGTVTNLTITDVASNAKLTISGTLPSKVIIDNSTFKVKDGTGASIISQVTRQNSNGLLPLNPVSSTEAPKLKFEGTGAGSIQLEVSAKRRYLVA